MTETQADRGPSHGTTAAPSDDSFVGRLAAPGRWFAQPSASRPWGRYAVQGVAAATVGLLVYAAAVAAVNPRGEFPWQVVPPISSEDPAYKRWLLDHQAQPPEVLVLGSSRSQKVAPADVEAASGLRAFNFAIADAYPEDALRIYSGLRDGVRPREVILGLDLNRLEPRGDASERTRHAFGPLHGEPTSADWLAAVARTYTDLYALQAGGALLEAVGAADAGLVDFDGDGLAHYVPWETAVAQGTFDQEQEIARFLGGRSGYRPFNGLDEGHTGAVRDLVALARADGVTVRVWLSPVHPDVEANYGNASYPRHVEAARGLLASLCQPGVHAHDYTGLEAFGGRPEWFFDGSHMMQENTRRVVQGLYAGAGDLCASP